MTFPESLGSLGVSILLLAFLLNLLKVLKTDSLLYTLLNLLGAGIACYASYLIPYFPFVILEGVWTVLSFVALVRLILRSADSKSGQESTADELK